MIFPSHNRRIFNNPAIKAMLNYLKNSSESNVINNDIRELHQYVTTVKLQPKVRDEYMH